MDGKKRLSMALLSLTAGGVAAASLPKAPSGDAGDTLVLARPAAEQQLIETLREMATPSPVRPEPAPVVRRAPARPAPQVEVAAIEPEEPRLEKRVEASSLNVRKGPSSQEGIVGAVTRGTSVVVVESNGRWDRIVSPDGVSGWAFGQYLSST